jgi:hypothetical protein
MLILYSVAKLESLVGWCTKCIFYLIILSTYDGFIETQSHSKLGNWKGQLPELIRKCKYLTTGINKTTGYFKKYVYIDI